MKSSFVAFWSDHLASKAKEFATHEADTSRVQEKVKSLLSVAGWLNGNDLSFSSDSDMKSAISASLSEVVRVAPRLGADRLKSISAAFQFPNASPPSSHPVSHEQAVCPRCKSPMIPVMLVNNEPAVFCQNDRVCELL